MNKEEIRMMLLELKNMCDIKMNKDGVHPSHRVGVYDQFDIILKLIERSDNSHSSDIKTKENTMQLIHSNPDRYQCDCGHVMNRARGSSLVKCSQCLSILDVKEEREYVLSSPDGKNIPVKDYNNTKKYNENKRIASIFKDVKEMIDE